jgi:hypothetical protein
VTPVGPQLANVVLSATWAHLSPMARLVFARMAMTALDQEGPGGRPARRYFGGRDALVLLLDGELAEDLRDRHRQYRRVLEAVREISDGGGIKLLRSAHRGHNAEYEILVLAREMGAS